MNNYSTLETTLPESVFSLYKKTNNEKMQNIMKKTKQLLLTTREYSQYVYDYMRTTQVFSFKKPEITEYPVLKNQEAIPLYKQNLNFTQTFSRNKLQHDIDSTLSTPKASILLMPIKKKYKERRKKQSLFNTQFNYFKSNNSLLIDLLFFDGRYSKLYYDEKKIFHREREYEEFIYEHLSKLKKNLSENLTNILTRTYNDNTIQMELKSINIEFKCISTPTMKPIVYTLPFDYLPLFYFKGFRKFTCFILAMIKFDNSAFDKVSINTIGLENFIKEYSFEKSKIKHCKTSKPEKIKSDNGNNPNLPFPDPFSTLADPYKIEEKTPTNKFQFQDLYTFIWNTPKEKYNVELRLPEVAIQIKNTKKIIISSFINSEMMMFLLKEKFLNWDFYLIRYLLSFKNFRYMIEGTLSKNEILDNTSNISTARTPTNKRGIINFEYHRIDTIRHKDFITKGSYGKDFFLYMNTDTTFTNHLNIVYNHKLHVQFSGFEYVFKFTFNQIKILALISDQDNIKNILSRLVILDHSTGNAKFDYAFFDAYDIDNNKIEPLIIEERIHDNRYLTETLPTTATNITTPTNCIHPIVFNTTSNDHRMMEYVTTLLPMKISNTKISRLSHEINKEVREFEEHSTADLMKIDMKEWPKYISDNAKKILIIKNMPFQKASMNIQKGSRKTGAEYRASQHKMNNIKKFSVAGTPSKGFNIKNMKEFKNIPNKD